MTNNTIVKTNSSDVIKVKWDLTDDYWLLVDEQLSVAWFTFRRGRATGSVVGGLANHSNFDTIDDCVAYTLGIKEKSFTDEQKKNMKNGQIREPIARDFYIKNKNRIVIEVGLVIPRWESRIGASVDGIVINPSTLTKKIEDYLLSELIQLAEGIVEIKSPKRMYPKLVQRNHLEQKFNYNLLTPNNEVNVWERYYDHIWQSHFDQMQQGMAILRKPWCDYIVYTPEQIFIQRIPYCHEYYIGRILTPARKVFDNLIDPYMKKGRRVPLPNVKSFENGQCICEIPSTLL